MQNSTQVSSLLDEVRRGDRLAFEKLFEAVYSELRRMAARHMQDERPGHTLQATALVHEVYLRMAARENKSWDNRRHFFSVAAAVMRSLLVDHARGLRAAKRGGPEGKLRLEQSPSFVAGDPAELIALDDALQRLSQIDPRQSRVVELRYFAGLELGEIGKLLGVSERTVKRDWRMAKAWLYGEIY